MERKFRLENKRTDLSEVRLVARVVLRHLGMQSIDALADALDEFTGGVILVSHDSRLISRVCEDEEKSEIWVVENGTVSPFSGTFKEYKEELQREIKAEVDA